MDVKHTQSFLLIIDAESVIEVVYSIAWLALVYLPLSRRVYECVPFFHPLLRT